MLVLILSPKWEDYLKSVVDTPSLLPKETANGSLSAQSMSGILNLTHVFLSISEVCFWPHPALPLLFFFFVLTLSFEANWSQVPWYPSHFYLWLKMCQILSAIELLKKHNFKKNGKKGTFNRDWFREFSNIQQGWKSCLNHCGTWCYRAGE